MKKLILFTFIGILFIQTGCKRKTEIDLQGKWSVKLSESDRNDPFFVPCRGLGPTQNIMYSPTKIDSDAKITGEIILPGTLDEYNFGNPVREPDLGCLSRKVRFIGEATYSRTFTTKNDADWELFLERVLWKSSVKIDGIQIGTQESLATPHTYLVKNLKKGKHTIEITVDNTMIQRLGEKGHAYGEHMQTIWNGILGKIKLSPVPPITNVRINAPYPAEKVEIAFKTTLPLRDYTLCLRDHHTQKLIAKGISSLQIKDHSMVASLNLKGKEITSWDEFTPKLYNLELFSEKKLIYQQTIGFRSFKREGNKLFINDKPLFLRGNLDNCNFPLTGYPSTQHSEWRKIFGTLKENGCNNIRFHSYCPPQAAFDVADEIGLYLAPEAGIWIDGWMPGQLIAIGQGNNKLDNFVLNELESMIYSYGNHASFAMIGIGNEMGNSNFDLMKEWIQTLKTEEKKEFSETDKQQRLYSVCTARSVTDEDDFNVTHHAPGIGSVRQNMFPHTNWNYENLYKQTLLPTIAHEIGQWPVYPDWNEIKKYNGVLRPRNLEVLRDEAQKKNVLTLNEKFHFASGMQNKMMYKDEIESFMRTPSCAGIHLLGMQDYSGQGEALIGFLDSFYDEKGFWSAPEVRGCFSSLVTLASFDKYGWKTSETFSAKLMLRNMKESLSSIKIHYEFRDKNGIVLQKGYSNPFGSKNGELTLSDTISIALNNLGNNKITLFTTLYDKNEKKLSDTNYWSFWTFDEIDRSDLKQNEITVTSDLKKAIKALQTGEKVLLDASLLGEEGSFLKGDWGSVYWSTTWFPGQSNQTLGLWLEKEHPILKNLSCEGFGDWIWWNICEKGRIFDLGDFPKNYIPIAMPVPDFHNNQRLGTVFELKVKSGKLLVSGYPLNDNTIEQRIFKKGLMDYLESNLFDPQIEMPVNWLNKAFSTQEKEKIDLPEKYAKALLYLECGGGNNRKDRYYADARLDYRTDGIEIEDGRWIIEENGQLTIKTPAGELGLLHIVYSGSGNGTIESRPFELKNAKNAIHTFFIDREDCLDGSLILKLETNGKNSLCLHTVVFIPKETTKH